MPKDADFNVTAPCGGGDPWGSRNAERTREPSGIGGSVRPVDAFAQTKGASGGIDFWSNCWEWY